MSTPDVAPVTYLRHRISTKAPLFIAPGSSRYLGERQFDGPSTVGFVANVMKRAWDRMPRDSQRKLKWYWKKVCRSGIPDIRLVDELTIQVGNRIGSACRYGKEFESAWPAVCDKPAEEVAFVFAREMAHAFLFVEQAARAAGHQNAAEAVAGLLESWAFRIHADPLFPPCGPQAPAG